MSRASAGRPETETALSYEDAKRIAGNGDPAARAALARRSKIRPELLYFLAEDPSSEVRRGAAGNERTPPQADLVLARDADEAVRADLAIKLARIAPGLSEPDQKKAENLVVQALEALARDQARRVRLILSEALRNLAQAPPSVIRQLARDTEEVVACPVLEFSPLLSDEDLIEIIGEDPASGKLEAISRRRDLAAAVSDAIVGTDDRGAITALLANGSAQIREETLDVLVERARRIEDWQGPLVERPRLPAAAAQKLAGFVAHHLLERLKNRKDLDQATTLRVAAEVRRRLGEGGGHNPAVDEGDALARAGAEADRLHDLGQLDDEALLPALARGDRELVRAALARLTGFEAGMIARILESGSAKGVTSLAWKAGLGMRFATQLQIRMAGILPSQALNARDGLAYPLTPEEMIWQLEFFGAVSSE